MPKQTMPQYYPLTLEELHHRLSELLTQQSPHTPTNVLQAEITDTNPRQRRTVRLWTVGQDQDQDQAKNRPVVVEDLP